MTYDKVIKDTPPFEFRVVYYDKEGKVIKSQIQSVPKDNKTHWSKLIKEEDVD